MNLLEEEEPKKQEKPNSKKIIEILLILSVVALVIVFGLMMFADNFSSNNSIKEYKIQVNNLDVGIQTVTQNEIKYVSIKDFASKVDYDYFNGTYKGEPTEEKKNCYIKNSHNEVIEFTLDDKIAYKFNEDTITEKMSLQLNYSIIAIDNKVYISLEDMFRVACVYATFESKTSVINAITTETFIKQEESKTTAETPYFIDTDYENSKAVLEGLMVVSEDGKYGAMDLNKNEVIGKKYKSMQYDEYTKNFIVSNTDGLFGVIDKTGNGKISLKYDKLYIVSYSPLLYAVMKNSKYGVIDENEEIVVSIVYDRLACAGDVKNEFNQTFIIHNIKNNDSGMVVCKDNKYGIVDLTTKKMILECQVDKIYSKANADGTEKYVVIVNEEEFELQEYLDAINMVVVIQN